MTYSMNCSLTMSGQNLTTMNNWDQNKNFRKNFLHLFTMLDTLLFWTVESFLRAGAPASAGRANPFGVTRFSSPDFSRVLSVTCLYPAGATHFYTSTVFSTVSWQSLVLFKRLESGTQSINLELGRFGQYLCDVIWADQCISTSLDPDDAV